MLPLAALWSDPSGSSTLFIKLIAALVVCSVLFFAVSNARPQVRRIIVGTFTFLAGLYYVAYFLWPQPINKQPGELPNGVSERVGFFLSDALPNVANFSNILTAFMIGLGVYSVLRIHIGRLSKMQKDWGYSIVLLVSMVLMTVYGYWDWWIRTFGSPGPKLEDQANWGAVNYIYDLLFDGLLQQMDAAMFSVISFYILSAAYRAFRVRSIEATILLATALVVMLSLLGGVEYVWSAGVHSLTHQDPAQSNWTLTAIAGWIKNSVQTASIRGIDFGVGIGALAMGLRLWLSLEKQGGS